MSQTRRPSAFPGTNRGPRTVLTNVLFANAVTGSFAALGEITPAHYDQIFDVNVKGLVFTVQEALTGGEVFVDGGLAQVSGASA
jgi:NAD(P)-dependent dehydrogenase (short-subunit alcohol dehydrogenase family)